MANALITVPKTAKRGDIIEIKALVQHPMETGYRRSSEGELLPRNLIRRFSCRLLAGRNANVVNAVNEAGALVFSAVLHAAIAANPYLAFNLRATASGTLLFVWEGDNGFVQREVAYVDVTDAS